MCLVPAKSTKSRSFPSVISRGITPHVPSPHGVLSVPSGLGVNPPFRAHVPSTPSAAISATRAATSSKRRDDAFAGVAPAAGRAVHASLNAMPSDQLHFEMASRSPFRYCAISVTILCGFSGW